MNWATVGARWTRWRSRLFPELPGTGRRWPAWAELGLFAGLAAVFTWAGGFLPVGGNLGWDWRYFWGQHRIPAFYPPWTAWVVAPLTWPLLIGLTLAAVGVAGLRRAAQPLSLAAALLSLPVFWVVGLGQLDGLVVLGVLGLPWLAPLVLMKPQVAWLGLAARPAYLLAAGAAFLVSLAVWGVWPLRILQAMGTYGHQRAEQDIGLGLWGLPLLLLLAWPSRGDVDMLMIAGASVAPYLVPYSLLPLTPALARLPARAAWVGMLLSWTPFLANWLGPAGWWLGWTFVGYLWLCLALQRYPQMPLGRWLRPLLGLK